MYTIYVTGEKHNSLGKGVTANKKKKYLNKAIASLYSSLFHMLLDRLLS